jgi:serine protease Do
MSAGFVLSWLLAFGQSADDTPRKVYEKAAESVVAVGTLATATEERRGTGVVLTKDGLILTSYSICPEGATKIRVRTRGPREYAGELVATSRKDEISLVRIKPRGELKPIEMGRSSGVRVGDVSFTLGNAANSIWHDDQPSLNAGIVSGVYRVREEKANSWYVGPVIETTAAVNVGMEGAPCLDAAGRMIGMVTLNYSPHRFLGAAIPVEELQPVVARLREAKPVEEPVSEAGEGTLGMKVKDVGGKVVVDEIDDQGPAARAGLAKGDVLVEMADSRIKNAQEVAERLKGLEAGSIVWFKIDLGGRLETVKITLEKKK